MQTTAGIRRAVDPLIVAALGAVAYLVRKGSLPNDGLWFDDSWVATGAIHGRVIDLMTVGSGQPGLTATLMAVHRLGTGQLRDLGIPSLVAGILAPMLLYIALRRVGYERSIAAAVGATLAVAPIHILYSGRVKGYTLDTLWVIVLVIVVPVLARRTWRWPLAVAWVVGAFVVGTFSPYTLVATAVAAVVLALHPNTDRVVRVAAVGVQAAAQLIYYRDAQSRTDLVGLQHVIEVYYDGYMTRYWNPIDFARESVTHLGRVAEVFAGGSGLWVTLLGLLAVAGLIVASLQGRARSEHVAARYLLLLLAVAFGASLLGRFPFGPTNFGDPNSSGGRHTLWLLPAMAFGVAAIAHRFRDLVVKSDRSRLGFDLAAVAAAIAIVVAGYGPAPAAPLQGSESATRYLEASLRRDDVVIITGIAVFAFADSARSALRLVPTPHHQVGFAPVYRNPRIHVVGPWALTPGTPAEVRAWVRDAKRVLVQIQWPSRDPMLAMITSILESEGFRMTPHPFLWSTVEVWTRTEPDTGL